MLTYPWRKWFSWRSVTLITGEDSWLQIIERRRCEDFGGDYWEYRKPVVEEEIVEDLTSSEVSTAPIVPKYSSLLDGFYWVYCERDGEKVDVCLVKLYNNPDSEETGIGYGIWDGCGFVPLTDLSDDVCLVPLELSVKDQMYSTLSSRYCR